MPITLSGKKHVLDKQVSKYVHGNAVLHNKISVVHLYLLVMDFFTMCTLCAFSITRLLNARLPLAGF